MIRTLMITIFAVAIGFLALRHFTKLNPGDSASFIVAEATAILTILTYISLRESQRQSRFSIRREHLHGLQNGPLKKLQREFENFYQPLFQGDLILPFQAPVENTEMGHPRSFMPDLLLKEELDVHFPTLKKAIEDLGTEYDQTVETLIRTLMQRIRSLFQDFSREYPHMRRWEIELYNFCAPLVILGKSGLNGYDHIIAQRNTDVWHLLANSSMNSLDIDLGPNKNSGEALWAIIPAAIDDPLHQSRAAIETLRNLWNACRVQFEKASAAQQLHGNCDLAPSE